ncbi:MAG: FtsQ-type POTRA domain-containing protein [Desulfuromonadaceae bacterium]|nr:FtsQ-type POTRA domain-containing protein [Desulfuromonas sp.]MDY0184477.1 FtsQ-type POTRA domain-containing protein [Desulfuromonadaceae bacterium]
MTASGRMLPGKKKKNLKNRRVGPKKDYTKIFKRVLYVLLMLICGAALLAGAGFGMYLLSASDAFKVDSIEVNGNQHLTREEILALSDIRLGRGTFDLDLELIGKRLVENEWISQVKVERQLPRGITVSVDEHIPCCIINLGYLYYVDNEAQIFKVLHHGDSLDYPLVSGFKREDLAQEQAVGTRWLEQVVEVVEELRRRTVFDITQVAQVHVDFERGLELFTVAHGVALRLGKDHLSSKLDLLEHMYPELKAELGLIEYIDLNVPGKLIVKKLD